MEIRDLILENNSLVFTPTSGAVDLTDFNHLNFPISLQANIVSSPEYIITSVSDRSLLLEEVEPLTVIDETKQQVLTFETTPDSNVIKSNNDLSTSYLFQFSTPNDNDVKFADNQVVPEYILSDVTQKGLFTCSFCPEKFENNRAKRRHELIKHINKKPFECGKCNASFNVLRNLQLHEIICKDSNSLLCHMCNVSFTRIAGLKSHLLIHEVDERIYCTECEKPFETKLQMEHHLTSHSKRTQTHFCNPCKIEFKNPIKYRSHVAEHSRVRLALRKLKTKLQNKKGKKNPSRLIKKHECKECKKSFSRMSQLIRHTRVHTGEKPFKCSKCDHAFSQANTLKIHMNTHGSFRALECSFCHARFNQMGNLRVHISKLHSLERTGSKYFPCKECNCNFVQLSSLNAHINKVHASSDDSKKYCVPAESRIIEKQETSSLRDEIKFNTFNTRIKQISFADRTPDGQLRSHLIKQRSVGNVRWHQCNSCSKEFKKPSDLVRHFRTHTKEKPFQCMICNRSFAIKGTLTSHIRLHTRQHQKIKKLESTKKKVNSVRNYTKPRATKPSKKNNSTTKKSVVFDQFADSKMNHTTHSDSVVINSDAAVCSVDISNVDSKNFYCHICSKKFEFYGKWKVHMRTHMRSNNKATILDNRKVYTCPFCSKMFLMATNYRMHLKLHRKETMQIRNSTTVLDDPVIGDSNFDVNEQSQDVDIENDQIATIENCESKFKTFIPNQKLLPLVESSNNTLLKLSENAEINQTETNFEIVATNPNIDCNFPTEIPINIVFAVAGENPSEDIYLNSATPPFLETTTNVSTSSLDLKTELKATQSKNQSACSFCSKSFKKPSDLKRHERTHTGEKPYNCNICERSFSLKSTLKSHMKIHESKTKLFRCYVCFNTFASKGSLNVHMRLHTGDKPFKCNFCDLQFRTSGHRQHHLKTHTAKNIKSNPEAVAVKTNQNGVALNANQLLQLGLQIKRNDNLKELIGTNEASSTEDISTIPQLLNGPLLIKIDLENITTDDITVSKPHSNTETETNSNMIHLLEANEAGEIIIHSLNNEISAKYFESDGSQCINYG